MKPQERAKELAAAHWGYIEKLLEAHGYNGDSKDIIGFHYRTAMEHGHGHGVEDQHNGMFDAEVAPAAVADAKKGMVGREASSNLCESCRRTEGFPRCLHDYPVTKDGGCEGYIAPEKENLCRTCVSSSCPVGSTDYMTDCAYYLKEEPKAERKASLCHSCARPYCDRDMIISCEESGKCSFYISALRENMLDAKQEAPTAADLPLDFTLPSITLKCTAEEAAEKFWSEREEWKAAEDDSFHELVERWDCLQALYTFAERGGDVEWYQDHVRVVMEDLARCHANGRDVMGARAACLNKNALRSYYAPETCASIIASKGHRFQPLDEMGVI